MGRSSFAKLTTSRTSISRPKSANSDRTSLIAAIAPIGRSDGADFWIDIEKLKQLSGRQLDPQWAKRFHTMLAFAKQFGWINEDGTEVRCHVKPLPE